MTPEERRARRSIGPAAPFVAAALATLTSSSPVPAAAQGVPVDGFAVLGHVVVLDVVQGPWWTWSLGDDGLIVAWAGSRVADWASVPGATHLARVGDGVAAITPDSVVTFAPPLSSPTTVDVRGTAPCRGAGTAWAWTDASTAVYLSDAGRRDIVGPAPGDADGRCTVAGESAALAWDDGFGAVALTTEGESFDATWFGDGTPRAELEVDGWRLLAPTEVRAGDACDVQSPGEGPCGAPSPELAERFRAPVIREPIAAVASPHGLAIADAAGWTVVDVGGPSPVVRRFQRRVVAMVDGDPALVVTCREGAITRFTVNDVESGEQLASSEIAACPVAAHRVAGRLAIEGADGTVFVATESGRLVDAVTVGAGSGFRVDASWSSACAGPTSTVTDIATGRTLFGPVCGDVDALPVRDPAGRRTGLAVCVGDEPAPVAVLRLDGAPLPGAIGACDGASFVLPTETATAAQATDGRQHLRLDGARLHVETNTGVAEILVTDAGPVVRGDDWIWAATGVWDRVVWWSNGTARTPADPATSSVWRPAGLGDLLADDGSGP